MELNINDVFINRYNITRKISIGVFGTVYHGFDQFTTREVAIKLFNSNLSEYSSARIQREVEIISKLRHPNIVTMFDVGLYNKNYYIIQEYISGGDLKSLLHKKYLDFHVMLNYSVDILNAVSYLHKQGIIHRDLKPTNIMIDNYLNRAVLTDFGISKFGEDNMFTTITSQENFVGTPAYMAPEQFANSRVTTNSDIYSLGLLFYEMFTGKLPFDHKSMMEIVSSRLAHEYSIAIELPGVNNLNKLNDTIKQMLSMDQESRPTANEVLEVFNRLVESNPQSEKPYINNVSTKYQEDSVVSEAASEAFQVKIDKLEKKNGTGFFLNEEARRNEFNKSTAFYRQHLDKDYKTLLSQAKISFWLWFSTLVLGLGIMITAICLVVNGELLYSGVTLVGEVFVFIVQNIFKIREDHYRSQADQKTKHLEIGNYWNLSAQSIDVIEDTDTKQKKLTELIDGLLSHIHYK